ncbi:MAG: hypothetical protein CH6_3347 [Candidatus Kapaibacterium sp.]|nr:MAG: hypothetical protein CH6_3347 [Candidatus Kapabacteria bacterium]
MRIIQNFLSTIIVFIIPFSLFSASYIVKFKSVGKKDEFYQSHSKILNFRQEDLPILKSIDNILNKKDLELDLNLTSFLTNIKKYAVIYIADELKENELLEYLSHYDIEYIEPNFTVSVESLKINDNLLKEQWYLNAINALNAWDKATGKDVLVSVVDTGLDFLHKEFQGRIWINPKEDINHNGTFEPWSDTVLINGISGDLNGVDDDGNGFVDDIIGYDFVNQKVGNFGDYLEPDPIPDDEHGHGTMVAGVICAGLNDTGIVGVAPGAKIVVLRAFDVTGNAEVKDIASAIIYAALNRVKVINLSFGMHFDSKFLHEAIKFAASKGSILVASAGNDGQIVEHYPSDYPEVLSVGATTPSGTIGRSSNYGPLVDIFAPGYEILTTAPNNGYKILSGTSFSSPIVSGVIALMLQLNPNLTLEDVRAILKSTQKPITDKRSYGQGIVNAQSAVDFVGTSSVEILSPYDNQSFVKENNPAINIVLNVFSPLFESYDVLLLKNDSIILQKLVENMKNQRFFDTVKLITSNLDIGTYNIQLKVLLKNQNYFYVNKRFNLFSRNSNIVLSENNVIYAIFESEHIPLYVCKANFPTSCFVSLYSGEKLLGTFSDYLFNQQHFVPIKYNFSLGTLNDYYLIVEQKTNFGLTRLDTIKLQVFTPIHQYSIRHKFNTLLNAYIFRNSIKLRQFDKKGILINPYNQLDWSGLDYYEFKDSVFIKRATYPKPFVPVDIGNSNGNSLDEVLTTSYGRTIVFEPLEPDKFFENIIFQSRTDETLWGSQFYDIDNDGKDELICYSDDAIKIYTFTNSYVLSYVIRPPDTLGLVGTRPNIQIADFDLDGNIEIAFFTTSGYLLIYQFERNISLFSLEFFQKLILDPFSVSACITKIPNNIFDQAVTFVGAVNVLSDNLILEYSTIWKLYKLKAIAPNIYTVEEDENFWGARVGATPQGIFYRNGINSADVDYLDGDELFLSLFPNLYVFRYDVNSDKYKQFLWLPYVYSNTVVVDDFDNDGNKEFGVSRWDGVSFYQFQTQKLSTPINTDGWIDIDDFIYVIWDKVEKANLYQVYEYDKNLNILKLLDEVYGNNYQIQRNFIPGERIFFVRAIDTLNLFEPSDYSQGIFVYDTILTKPLKINEISLNHLIISFQGKLSQMNIPVKEVELFDQNRLEIPIHSVEFVNDTALLVATGRPLKNERCEVIVGKFRDFWGNYTQPDTLNFELQFQEERDSLLVFQRFEFIDDLRVDIVFPQELDRKSVLNKENYAILPFGNIDLIEMPNEKTIRINFSSYPNIFSLGKDFFLVLKGIYNLDSSKYIKPPFNSICITREAKELERAFAYPNPVNLNLNTEITFANLPRNSKVEIYNKEFQKLYELQNDAWRGGVSVNIQNIDLNLSPGIYYFRVVMDSEGVVKSSSLKKFAVVK